MKRFDVYKGSKQGHYLLNVQADIMQDLMTRIAVPLVPLRDVQKPIQGLNPILDIHGELVVMRTQFLAAVPVHVFKELKGSMNSSYDEIMRAIDLLFSGF